MAPSRQRARLLPGWSRRALTPFPVLLVLTTVLTSGCATAARTQPSRLPRAVLFQVIPTPGRQPDCGNPAGGSGVAPAGGPLVNYVTAEAPGGEAFADCNLVATRPDGSSQWHFHHLQMDVMGLSVLSDGRVLGFGFNPAGTSVTWSMVSGPVASGRWTATRLTGIGPSTYDSLSCSLSGQVCVAFPAPDVVWEGLCPTPVMGAPTPPPATPTGPVFIYRPGSGWAAITGLPANLSTMTGAVTSDGAIILGGSEDGRGVILTSENQGLTFVPRATPPAPVTAIAANSQRVVAVGGTPSCDFGPTTDGDTQEIYSSSASGTSWTKDLDLTATSAPLTGVALTGSGSAVIAAGSPTQCGLADDGFCFQEIAEAPPSLTSLVRPAHFDQLELVSFAASGSRVLAVNSQGLLEAGAPSLGRWTVQGAVTEPALENVNFFPSHPTMGVAELSLGSETAAVETDDGGFHWTSGPVQPRSAAGPIAWASFRVGFAVGQDPKAGLLVTTDGGHHWRPYSWPGDDEEVSWLYFQSPKVGFAALDTAGGMMHLIATSDGGRQWRPVAHSDQKLADLPADIAAVRSGGETTIAVLREWGWRLITDGRTVSTTTFRGPVAVSAVALQPGGLVWAAGTSSWWYAPSPILLVSAGGHRGRRIGELPFDSAPQEMEFSTARDGWMVDQGQLFTTQDGGLDWKQVPLRAVAVAGYSVS